jgi:hypothetical protein
VFETAIPTDLLPPLAEFEVPPPPPGADSFDEAIWAGAETVAGEALPGEVVIDPADDWAAIPPMDEQIQAAAAEMAPPSPDGVLPPDGDNVEARWTAARDANIRPYLHWRPPTPVTLPVLTIRPSSNAQQPRPQHGHQQHPGHNGQPRGGRPGFSGKGPYNGGGGGGGGGGGRRRRGRDRDRERDRHRGGGEFNRNRERGPRLPGFYNPGGD